MKFLYRAPAYTYFFLSFIALSFSSSGQSYVSKASGNWVSAKSWNSLADACSQNPSGPVPPLSKDWGCPVDITIRHQITYAGSLTNFGNGLFGGLEISPGGTLTLEGDFQLPAHGWGPLTYLRMGEGSSLHVVGTFSVGKADQVIIAKNSTVTLGSLIVDDNSRGIVLEEGASLVVLNGTTIKAKSSLHVKGEFITKNLINNSGSFLSSGKGSTEIEGNLELNESASLLLSEGSKMTSGGSLISQGAGRMDLTGNSQIAFAGDMNLSQGSKYTFNDHSSMQVGGKLASTGGSYDL